MKPEIELFHEKISIDPSGCHLWTACTANGYGSFGVKRKMVLAHRYSYQLVHGEIPQGMCVCHTCDVRLCVNPNHLFLGTQLDNIRDMYKKGRENNPGKLKKSEVLEIRKIGRTKPLKEVAGMYGVHLSTISEILLRKTWRQI